jgi:hypothetical protein
MKNIIDTFMDNAKDLNITSMPMARKRSLYEIIKTINYQFPQTPEGILCVSIIGRAIYDYLTDYKETGIYDAEDYLAGDMNECVMCGVEPRWVRDVLRTFGIWDKQE